MIWSLFFLGLGLLMIAGSIILPREKRSIIKTGTEVRGRIIDHILERRGGRGFNFSTKYLLAFDYKGEHHELPTLTYCPALFKRKIGREETIYFSEKHPDSVVIKGTYWEEIYAVAGIFFGVVFTLAGIAGIMAQILI